MKKITKIIAAGLLAAAAVTGLAGCGQTEQEKALAPYVGTWVNEEDYMSMGKMKHLKSSFEITKNEKNPNTLIAKYQLNDKKPKLYEVAYDEKDKSVKVSGNQQIVIQKDDKGEYITGTAGTDFNNTKYYKQK